MSDEPVIRENKAAYMEDLRRWLDETEGEPLEGMADFFRLRLAMYEGHMQVWKDAYRRMAELIPADAGTILDLGCGTGLEIDAILALRPELQITGIDLSDDMLQKLREKHSEVRTICGDYFLVPFGEKAYDCVISFESLHHFRPEEKLPLYEKIHAALKPGGVFLEADYLACCPEEEELLMDACRRKRDAAGIPAGKLVHFDTPLTVAHETALLAQAGFSTAKLVDCIEGASFLWCAAADDSGEKHS